MKPINKFLYLRIFWNLLGRKGFMLMALAMVSTLMLAGAEYGLSALSVALLSPLINATLSAPSLSMIGIKVSLLPQTIFFLLLLTILIRSICKLVSSQSAHILLQLSIKRFRNIQGYELLMTDQGQHLPLSKINTRFNELIPKASEFVFLGTNLLAQLLFASALLVGMFLISSRDTLLAIGLMLILSLVILKIMRLLTMASEEIARQSLRLEKTIVRISRNWLFIRLMHTMKKEMNVFTDAVQGYYRQGIRIFFYANSMSILPQILGMTSISFLIFIKIYYFKEGGAELLIFFYLFIRFVQAVSFINDQAGKMGHSWYHFREMIMLTDSIDTDEKFADEPKTSLCASIQCPDLQIKDISFAWPGINTSLFHNFSLSVSAGSHYGIIGPNGSGKSTLLALIFGVLNPDKGSVQIGGMRPRQFLRERRDFGFVSTDPFLFDGTIFENITYGCTREIPENEMQSILKTIGLNAKISGLKGGLQARLGENGDGFSAGEKQRLALGRALLRKPTLLVLDEATANFDIEMEKDVIEILNSLHGICTVITVTHRTELLKNSDGILDLGKLL
jgi:ABC-type multidrug transport system fused ATPase/permease subunit